MKNSRLLAVQVLKRLLDRHVPLDDLLEQTLDRLKLKASDRAFVKALCYETVRWFHRLKFLLDCLTHHRIEDRETELLALVGLCQLRTMAVKPYAAVSETVEAARHKPWAKGLLNAILRRYLRERKRLEVEADRNYEARYSHPAWLRRRIEDAWPNRSETILEANNRHPPMTLRVNLARTSLRAYAGLLAQHGLTARPVHGIPSALILDQPVPVKALPGFKEGLVSVQDAAAQLAAFWLDLKPGQRVLDLCAAPGGKTLHLLETCPELEEVVAIEVSADRIARLEENVRRSHFLNRVKVVHADAREVEQWWDGRPFDRILLDVPCSATGVIRRHPDIKLLRRERDIGELSKGQIELLSAAFRVLKKGGKLLYVTCSVLPAENHRVIAQWLYDQTAVYVEKLEAPWGRDVGFGRQMLPGEGDMDGFFYSRLRSA